MTRSRAFLPLSAMAKNAASRSLLFLFRVTIDAARPARSPSTAEQIVASFLLVDRAPSVASPLTNV